MSKILIVEDDAMLVEIYEKKFLDAGFEVRTVTNGKNVVEAAGDFQPDIILLDIVLPDMDGFEVLEALKKSANTKNYLVYTFSNLSSTEDMERARKMGAAGSLTKSNFTPSQLVDEIKKILNHPQAEDQGLTAAVSKESANSIYRSEHSELNGHKILIIEDEDTFIEMFGARLKQEGYEVVSAKNGKWGIKEAEVGGYACILMDMMMPAMNGYEAIKELKSKDSTKDIPIIILSNSALDSEVKQAMDLGADAYYIKTKITPGEVAQEVNHLIKN